MQVLFFLCISIRLGIIIFKVTANVVKMICILYDSNIIKLYVSVNYRKSERVYKIFAIGKWTKNNNLSCAYVIYYNVRK
jgi:hypothetical protein